MRKLSLLGLAALCVAGCSSDPKVPRAQNDICAIFEQQDSWLEAVAASAARWGAPIEVQMAIIWRESSFRHDARPPMQYTLGVPTGRASSAYGYSQAIDGTWDWYREETGNRRADRTDFEDAADFVGWYMAKTYRSNGVAMTDAFNQYLNYHEGHAGYRSGRWRGKDWLQRAASQVAVQAQNYGQQLQRCS